MADGDGRREELLREYERLSPEERHGRIVLNPVFRSAYNRISQAHRQFPVPAYLWERWVPILGLLPVGVYLELRRMCFVNDATGERRTIVWPKQETIAKRLGVKKRHTISSALVELELHGFIRRSRTTYNERGTGHIRRGVTEYDVVWEFPLVPADAVELFLEQLSESAGVTSETLKAEKRPYGENAPVGPVDNFRLRAEKRPSTTAEKRPCETLPRTITSTLTNVDRTGSDGNVSEPTLPQGPRPHPDSEKVRALVFEVGETLARISGTASSADHPSAGFHRRVCRRMPENLIREALAATRDAAERSRSGEGGFQRGAAAYFAGVVKKLAAQHGIDLGLKGGAEKRPPPSSGVPLKAPRLPQVRRAPVSPPLPPDSPPMSPELVREGLRALREQLARGPKGTP